MTHRMISQLFQVLSVSALSVGCFAAEEMLHPDTPFFTADQVLNNEFPGRKKSPSVEAIHNTEGFAAERLYSVPEPGMHPRIFFGPEDLPRIRRQFEESPMAGKHLEEVRQYVEKMFADPQGWGSQMADAIRVSDWERFRELWADSRNPKSGGPPGHGHNPLYFAITCDAFLALVDEDEARGRAAAELIANFAEYLRPQIEEAARQPGAVNFWLSVRGAAGDDATLGLMYDFAQPFMTPEQQETVRGTIASAIKDRYGLGMDLPPHWVNWNFIGMGLYFPLLALSIEGEPGYDERIYSRGSDVAQNYILYGNSANGVGREAIGYHTSGMAHTAEFMLAMANRGDNLFTLERWRMMFEKWLIYSMQPYGKEWQSSGDLGTFPPSGRLLQTAKYFYPEDQKISFVAENTNMKGLNWRLGGPWLQLLTPLDLDKDDSPAPQAAEFDLPLTQFDEQRGVLFARTGWGSEDVALWVNCRSDTTSHSHDHSDRGAFYLTALGQSWAVSSGRMTESKYCNTITIDGRGQGDFQPPGKWLEVKDTPEATFAVMDVDYCYDWQWQPTVKMMTDEQFEKEPWLDNWRGLRDQMLSRFPREQWERDPLPSVRDYYQGYMAGNPRTWGAESSWVVRTPHYPVEKAFRTIGLMKGKHPYVLIADDIKKDDGEHLYQWRMRLPMRVEAYDINGNDVILGAITDRRDPSYSTSWPNNKGGRPLPEMGQPLLLVRVLQANQLEIPTFQDNITVETVEFKKYDDTTHFYGRTQGLGKRLVIPSRSVAPDYKVLMIPFRHGEALPKTVLSEDGNELTVEWPDQKDCFDLKVNEAGRTVISKSK